MLDFHESLDVFAPDLFAGRTVVVTGGGRGIGRRIALAFGRYGANVVIASRHRENLDRVEEELRSLGAECLSLPTNIREIPEVEALLAASLERFDQVDFLINNAGGQFPARPTEITDRGWRAVVDLNLNGTWNMCSRFGRHMLARRFGSIVNIVHIYSYDRGGSDWAHSGAARAGVVNLTKSLAYHWAHRNVTVNALAPGMVDTRGIREEEFAHSDKEDHASYARREIPARRFGESDEIAAITLFLCSPAARFVNGASIVADGAQYLGRWTDFHDPEAPISGID